MTPAGEIQVDQENGETPECAPIDVELVDGGCQTNRQWNQQHGNPTTKVLSIHHCCDGSDNENISLLLFGSKKETRKESFYNHHESTVSFKRASLRRNESISTIDHLLEYSYALAAVHTYSSLLKSTIRTQLSP